MERVHTRDGALVSNEIGANEVTEQDLKRSLSGGELMYRRTKALLSCV